VVWEGTFVGAVAFFKPCGVGMSQPLRSEVSHTRKRGLVVGC